MHAESMWQTLGLQWAEAVSPAGATRCCDLLPQDRDTSPKPGIWHPWADRVSHSSAGLSACRSQDPMSDGYS